MAVIRISVYMRASVVYNDVEDLYRAYDPIIENCLRLPANSADDLFSSYNIIH